MDSNISEYSYNATSIDDYFTKEYNLEFNQQIVKELTEYSLSINIKNKKLEFTENNYLNGVKSNLRFTPLSFLNLFYHEFDFIISNKSKPLHIIPHLREIQLSSYEQLYFYDKLSDILIGYQNDNSLTFIGKNIKTEYGIIWHKSFGDILLKEIDLFSIEQKDLIIKKVKEFKTSAESLNFLIDLKHLLIEKELYSFNDKTFFNQVQSYIDYYKERKEVGIHDYDEKNIKGKTEDDISTIILNPIFKKEYIPTILLFLNHYFDSSQHMQLKALIETGQNSNEKLLFLSKGIKLANAFKQLKDKDIIYGCEQKHLATWIINNFKYKSGNNFKNFTNRYATNSLSKNLENGAIFNVIRDKSSINKILIVE